MDGADVEMRERVLGLLRPLPVTARGMFGGVGLYLEGRYFGLISGGVLYFRTDESSRGEYIARGMAAFMPAGRVRGPKTVDRNFRVPDEVMADGAVMRACAASGRGEAVAGVPGRADTQVRPYGVVVSRAGRRQRSGPIEAGALRPV